MIDKLDPVDRWHTERHSRFTASVIYKLLGTGSDGRGFSTTAMSYIEEKAIEEMTVLYERPELEFVESLMHGKYYEEESYHAYVSTSKNYSMRHFGGENPVFLNYNEYSGGSPDGLMGEGEKVHWIWEGKCPQNPKNHYLYCKMNDQWDLKEKRPQYYAQIQFLLMTTNADGADFSSFDNRFKNKDKQIKIIKVLPDQRFQNNLDIRLKLAQIEKLKIIQQFNMI